MKTTIWITTEFEASHRWPRASNYLKYEHRHLFKVKAWFAVTHLDRDIEFLEMKSKVTSFLKNKTFSGTESCEMFCQMLLNEFPTMIKVSVSEDGENGAECER